ncbi:MAG: hypothetical protein KAU38_04695, partial [Desulfobacterales bacterium]|nr:hypothetical protein [Desulfobacterales bacterium]
AISFASSKELNELSRIERYIGETLPEHVVPGLEPTRSLRPMTAKKKGGWQQHTVTARYSRGKNWGSTNKEKNVIVEYRNSKASRQARRTS